MELIAACKTCGLSQRLGELAPGMEARCVRCGSILRRRGANSLSRTAALSLAALMFYLPANLYPILRMEFYGVRSDNTVWDGVVTLYTHDEKLIAVIVFLASLAIPFLKLLGLVYLTLTTRFGARRRRPEHTWIHKAIEVIGPWAMLDVFLLAVLVALVKLGQLATVLPGPGLFPFTAVVVLTILATASFDPALIWEERNGTP